MKPQNILLDEQDRAYITDFGIAKKMDSTSKAVGKNPMDFPGGSEFWMAPEMYSSFIREENSFSTCAIKLDVFSLGLITLFAIDKDKFLKQKKKLNNDPVTLQGFLDSIKSRNDIDGEFFLILNRMLSFHDVNRISIEELYRWTVKIYIYIV